MTKIQNAGKVAKAHFTKHKNAYLIGGVALGGTSVGLTAGYYVGRMSIKGGVNLVADVNEGLMVGINNGTINQLIRRGHPGFEILCNETGESWASIRRAAEVAGVSVTRMTSHLAGNLADVDGKTYTNLGEMV